MSKAHKIKETRCRICNWANPTNQGKKLTEHIFKEHGLKAKEYTIKYIYGGIEPKCLECGAEVRYVALHFKEYCKEHSRMAMSKHGKIGQKITAEKRKGKNKYNDDYYARSSLIMKEKWKDKEYVKKVLSSKEKTYATKEYHEKQSASQAKRWEKGGDQRKRQQEGGCILASQKAAKKISASNRMKVDTFFQQIEKIKEKFIYVGDFEKEYKSNNENNLSFKCVKCNLVQERSFTNLVNKNGECHKCSYKNSKPQEEIASFVEGLGFKVNRNDGSAIWPKEIDVYIPDKNVGIEYHGLIWHSEFSIEDKKYHYNKWKSCENKNIKLIQIYEDEWRDGKEICKSIIKNKLGLTDNKIFARNCETVNIEQQTAKHLLNKWHIDGYVSSKYKIGLLYNNEIVSILTLRIPHQKSKYKDFYEISRFASKLNTIVIGGLGKLLKEAKNIVAQDKKHGILTYTNLRFGNGNSYKKVGFDEIGDIAPDYQYALIKKGIREQRFKYRNTKEKNEKQIAKENNAYKIWGPGNKKFIMKI